MEAMNRLNLVGVAALFGIAWLMGGPGAARAQQCEEPNMMITLDKSGSMSGTKWTQAQQAVTYVVNNYRNQLRLGLVLYPSNSSCAKGTVRVDVGGNEDQIITIVNGTSAVGGTPIAATLMELNQYRPLKDVNRRNFIMLITDGEEYCAAQPGEAVGQAAVLLQGGIRTYVIGFGSGVDANSLNAIAQAGGTDRGNDGVAPFYYQADTGQLQAVMTEIINQALIEECDDRDNDCDGLTDEPWPLKNTLCTVQQGQCTFPGVWKCNATRDGLVCDAQVQVSPEVCDGFDNDCNGLIDDGFPDADGDGYNNCLDCCDSGTEPSPGCSLATRVQIHPGAVEVCNGVDDNCNGAVDESDPQLGQACGGTTDVGDCSRGSLQCQDGNLVCLGAIGPGPEVCDNRDNDCDGQTDENLERACVTQCGQGVQVCQAGVWQACSVPHPTPELCDGVDNDCDGFTDEDYPLLGQACQAGLGVCHVQGVYVCSADRLQAVCNAIPPEPGVEVCNGLDDDCDGMVDESDPQLGLPCGVCNVGELPPCYREEGECQAGMWFCLDGGLQCLGEVEPSPEVCDGRDNDCDGLTDENAVPEICDNGLDDDCDGLIDAYDPDCGTACAPGMREPCGVDEGDCQQGVRVCDLNGAWGPCEGAIGPSPEVCDGRDNDCDGEIDEDAVPEICDNGIDDDCDGLIDGQDPDCGVCTPGEERPCGHDLGECRQGRQMCSPYGSWGPCAGAIGPEPERCDGRDNDCDGLTDEGHLCEGYEVCLCGVCADRCSAGECPAGNRTCVKDYCVADPCCGRQCEAGLECAEGVCLDRCVTHPVQCPDGEICRMGLCVPADCYHPEHACASDQVCVAGACQTDRCLQVDCPDGQYCDDGSCRPIACLDCGPEELCQAGQCVESPCAGLSCPGSQVCVGGQCARDPCEGVYCPQGSVCLEGRCSDDPCEGLACPEETRCQAGYCVAERPDGGQPDAGPDGGGPDGQDAGPDGTDGADAGDGADAADGGDPGQADGGGEPEEGSGCGCGAGGSPAGMASGLLLLLGLAASRRRRRP
jgi:MYXO-CTERM domain-containing protein